MANAGHATLRTVHVDAEMGFSGGEVQVFLLLEGLLRLGQKPVLVAPPGSAALEEARRRGIDCVAVAMRSDFDLPAVWKLRRTFSTLTPDLVHLHTGRATWLGGLASRSLGIPAITTRRMDRTIKRNLRNRLIYRGLVRRAVAISGPVLELLADGGTPRERLELIHSSLDPAALRAEEDRATWRARLGAEAEDVVVLVLANLVHRKGIDVLLHAVARANQPQLRLWIAGDGEESGALRKLCAQLGLDPSVRFLGRCKDSRGLLDACDFSCLPSRREGLGIAALESMAAARAVLATEVGGLAEAVGGGGGLLVRPEDVDGLAAGLRTLATDAGLRERLGQAGRQRLESRYLASGMVARYDALYRRVLEEANSG